MANNVFLHFFVFIAAAPKTGKKDDGSTVGVQAGQSGSGRDTSDTDGATGTEGEEVP